MTEHDHDETDPNSAPTDEPHEDELFEGGKVIDIRSGAWVRGLLRTEGGTPAKTTGNAALIMTHVPEFAGCIAYDQFCSRYVWRRLGPTVEGFDAPRPGTQLHDSHWLYVGQWLVKQHGVKLPKQSVLDAVEGAARAHAFHPLQEWLRSLTWDGRVRLPSWLHTGLGADLTPYSERIGPWWAVSAVARALRPGCQADHMLVLEGPQGSGKSSALRALCPNPDWFLFKLPNLRDYASAAHALQGKWLGEVGELDALRGSALTAIKEFLTLTEDTFRAPYERFVVTKPRTIVLAGSTNERNYLEDRTGARRFWPLRCGAIDRSWVTDNRDQLWAEAVVRLEQGGLWHPTTEEDQQLTTTEQIERHQHEEWEELIAAWAEGRESFTMAEVLGTCLNVPPERWERSIQTRVGGIVGTLGWEKKRVRCPGDWKRLQWRYQRSDPFLPT